jgi:hypothetical protein
MATFGAGARVTTKKDASGAVDRGTQAALLDLADIGFRASQEEVPVDRGTLLQSGVPPTLTEDGEVVWGYNAAHAVPVEKGAAPHWAPIRPLKGWARRVLGDESQAYAVQRKIAQEGTPAQPYIKPALDVMRAKLTTRGIGASIVEEMDDG